MGSEKREQLTRKGIFRTGLRNFLSQECGRLGRGDLETLRKPQVGGDPELGLPLSYPFFSIISTNRLKR